MERSLNFGVNGGVTPYLNPVSSPNFTTGLILGTKSGQSQHSKFQYNRNLSRNGRPGSSSRPSLNWNRILNSAVILESKLAAKPVFSWKSTLLVKLEMRKEEPSGRRGAGLTHGKDRELPLPFPGRVRRSSST